MTFSEVRDWDGIEAAKNYAMTMPVRVITHKGCPDGDACRWIADRFFKGHPDIEFYGCNYHEPFPKIQAGTLYFVLDFSFPQTALLEWEKELPWVEFIILDHHQKRMEEIFSLGSLTDVVLNNSSVSDRITLSFDVSKSGCVLAWEYFYPNEALPLVLRYVDARDRWQKDALPYVDEIHLGKLSLPWTNEVLEYLYSLSDEQFMDYLLPIGIAKKEERKKQIKEILSTQIWVKIAGYRVPAAEVNLSFYSDVPHELCLKYDVPFAACWSDTRFPGVRAWELRSPEGSKVNVAEIAALYGGGGHARAAGFVDPGYCEPRISALQMCSARLRQWRNAVARWFV